MSDDEFQRLVLRHLVTLNFVTGITLGTLLALTVFVSMVGA